jgi:hypothetical protein
MDDQKENGNYKPMQTFCKNNHRNKSENSVWFTSLITASHYSRAQHETSEN